VKILCVTSCFSGIVSTYLASEALDLAGQQLGHEILIETQGSAGSAPFVDTDIEQADGVIFAMDVPVVGRDRFAGKPYLEEEIASAIHSPRELIHRLVTQITDGTAKLVTTEPTAREARSVPVDSSSKRGFLAKLFGRGRRD
jgi:fructose-specific phosphotransferase system component IIB